MYERSKAPLTPNKLIENVYENPKTSNSESNESSFFMRRILSKKRNLVIHTLVNKDEMKQLRSPSDNNLALKSTDHPESDFEHN